MSRRQWIVRVGVGTVIAIALASVWVAMHATALKAKLAARELRTAATDEARAAAADRLLELGEPGQTALVEFIRAGDRPCRAAAVAAFERRLAKLPPGDSWSSAAAARLLAAFRSAGDEGRRAVLELIPSLLARAGDPHAPECREVVATGLTLPDAASRLLAVRLALHPDVKMRREVLPLLADPEPIVRQAALVAVGTAAPGEPVVPDEDLFRWLHDPDEGVRAVCHEVLASHDRTEQEIGLGRRLTSPDAVERLKLIRDLRYDDFLADPEPWLERLGRDEEPAVRAGAARAAAEISANQHLSCPAWVGRVASADSDPTVRLVIGYFQSIPVRAPGSR